LQYYLTSIFICSSEQKVRWAVVLELLATFSECFCVTEVAVTFLPVAGKGHHLLADTETIAHCCGEYTNRGFLLTKCHFHHINSHVKTLHFFTDTRRCMYCAHVGFMERLYLPDGCTFCQVKN